MTMLRRSARLSYLHTIVQHLCLLFLIIEDLHCLVILNTCPQQNCLNNNGYMPLVRFVSFCI